jgi:hypothetical protein
VRTLKAFLPALFLALSFSTAAPAAPTQVLSAVADLPGLKLTISGHNFGITAPPVVKLDGVQLGIRSATDVEIDADLPENLTPGTYYATVKFTGASNATTVALWVHVGIPGPQGPQGDAGPQGPPGPTGLRGPRGFKGLAGPAGATGPTGPQGPAGATGASGPAGSTGPAGSQGTAGPTGPSGAQGPAGANGQKGDTGPKGDPGPQGVAGADGAQGPEGPQGADGAAGADGAEGPQGPPGPSNYFVVYTQACNGTTSCACGSGDSLTGAVAYCAAGLRGITDNGSNGVTAGCTDNANPQSITLYCGYTVSY